ncbi:MAG: hypothetical protein H6735_04470 [Alphaproteobacteria bacterium]|nr:hypothetical protein [Alphaproteobacteria bacterium]
MLLTSILACATTTTQPTALVATPPSTTGAEVEDRFAVTVDPVDVLLVTDPALAPTLADALPALWDALLGTESDARVGVVSTALGDPTTAGEVTWLDPTAPSATWPVLGEDLPLGAVGATLLALDTQVRPGVEVRVLVAQEADDATPAGMGTDSELADRLALVGGRLDLLDAPASQPVLEGLATSTGGSLWTDATDALEASAPLPTTTFPLSALADPPTIEVEVTEDGVVLRFDGAELTYDPVANTVGFDRFVPSPGSMVVARYLPR